MSDLDEVMVFRSFVAAWERWDAHPGNEDRMEELVSAALAVALRWDASSSEVIRVMQEERRVDPGGSVLAAAERMRTRVVA